MVLVLGRRGKRSLNKMKLRSDVLRSTLSRTYETRSYGKVRYVRAGSTNRCFGGIKFDSARFPACSCVVVEKGKGDRGNGDDRMERVVRNGIKGEMVGEGGVGSGGRPP